MQELVPEATTALGKYARDLTALAKEGKLDPLVGRADEMRRWGLRDLQLRQR